MEQMLLTLLSPVGVFYLAAALLLILALMVVTMRNPVHAALSLVGCFCAMAVIWMLLEAEFLSVALVLVYVGAVMVLFLFVVMMLDINIAKVREGFVRALPIGLVVAGILAFLISRVVQSGQFPTEAAPALKDAATYDNTAEVGRVLFNNYMFQFEVASVILLVAIIVAIMLTLRKRPDTKYQQPHEQVQVKRADRVRLVKVDPVVAKAADSQAGGTP
jgi:NADH-quinone oxidoreductase subunit J